MKNTIFVLVIGLALISLGTSKEWTAEEQDEWEDHCYFRQCIEIKPEVLSYSQTQYPPKDSTIKKTYRKWMRGTKDAPVLLDNVRLSADPESFQLIAKDSIKRGDPFIWLDKKHYITNDMGEESGKATYTRNILQDQFTGAGHPYDSSYFASSMSALLHLYYDNSPLRPLMITVDADFYPPYLQCQKQEINLLKGTTEYWDLLNHRGKWWDEYTRTFFRQHRYTWPSFEYNLGGKLIFNKRRRATPPDEYMVMRSVNEREGVFATLQHADLKMDRIMPAFMPLTQEKEHILESLKYVMIFRCSLKVYLSQVNAYDEALDYVQMHGQKIFAFKSLGNFERDDKFYFTY